MGRLFGTDGARGVAITELTCELAMQIGRAAAMVLTKETNHKAKIIIGKDTRISGDILESALVAGICSVGADAHILGVVPTPAVAMLVKKYNADAGVMISASHNSVEFNGIKLFSGTGFKLSDEIENKTESADPIRANTVRPYRTRNLSPLGDTLIPHSSLLIKHSSFLTKSQVRLSVLEKS